MKCKEYIGDKKISSLLLFSQAFLDPIERIKQLFVQYDSKKLVGVFCIFHNSYVGSFCSFLYIFFVSAEL